MRIPMLGTTSHYSAPVSSRATTAASPAPTGVSFQEFAIGSDAAAPPGWPGDRQPPPVERLAPAGETDIHALGKPDPDSETLFRHRDQHRNVGVERLGNEIDEPFALGPNGRSG